MPSKETYCYRILKTYSLIVDFKGEPPRDNVPTPVEGETYKQWKKRVLGDDVTDVVIYTPNTPTHQTRMSTLQNEAGAMHLEKIFKNLEKTKEKQKKEAVKATAKRTEENLVSFPKYTLMNIIDALGESLEPPVRNTLNEFTEGISDNIRTEDLVKFLVKKYNSAVKHFRQVDQKLINSIK